METRSQSSPERDTNVVKLLRRAHFEACHSNCKFVDAAHVVLAALTSNTGELFSILALAGINTTSPGVKNKLRNAAHRFLETREWYGQLKPGETEKRSDVVTSAFNNSVTVQDFFRECVAPNGELVDWLDLEGFRLRRPDVNLSVDSTFAADDRPASRQVKEELPFLNRVVSDGEFDFEARSHEIAELCTVIGQVRTNNAMLLGEPGIGKTALIEGLAAALEKNVAGLESAEVYELDVGHLLSTCKYPGDFEDNIRKVIEFCTNPEQSIFLFVDEVHLLMGASGGSTTIDAANLLKPALARGRLRMIGATTLMEFRKYVEKDRAFTRRFQVVSVDELSVPSTIKILTQAKRRIEEKQHVEFTPKAIQEIVNLQDRFNGLEYFPDKALKFLDYVGSQSWVERTDKSLILVIDECFVRESYAKQIGIPVDRLSEASLDSLSTLKYNLKSSLIGQEVFVENLIDVLASTLFWRDPETKRPRISLLLRTTDPRQSTPVGMALADHFSRDLSYFLQLDLSSSSDGYALNDLIGPPVGIVGHDEGGKLSEQLAQKRGAVVLVRGFHQSHPSVQELICDMLENGRLNDRRGKHVEVTNCFFLIDAGEGHPSYKKIEPFCDESIEMNALSTKDIPEIVRSTVEQFAQLIDDRFAAQTQIAIGSNVVPALQKNWPATLLNTLGDYLLSGMKSKLAKNTDLPQSGDQFTFDWSADDGPTLAKVEAIKCP